MSNKSAENKASYKSHMWMMAICCGLPIIGFLALVALGISLPALETVLFLLCPIGMIGMMYLMHRDGCASRRHEVGNEPNSTKDKASDDLSSPGAKPGDNTKTTRHGWLEA